MKIREISENFSPTLNDEAENDNKEFDLAEDLLIFMRNDPLFYRKSYYPMIIDMMSAMKRNVTVDKKNSILPVVKKGYDEYCKKYSVNPKNPQYNKKNIMSLISMIYNEETQNINRGEYD